MKLAHTASRESAPGKAEEERNPGASIGLGTKLIVLFLLLSVVPLIAVSYIAFENSRQTIEQETIKRLLSITLLKEGELTRWIEDQEEGVQELASRRAVQGYASLLTSHEPTAWEYRVAHVRIREDHFNSMLEKENFLEVFLLRASDGLVLVSTDESQEGKYRENTPYFVKGRSHTYIQNAYYSLALGKPEMTIATPVKDEDGELLAVLATRVDLDEISGIMAQSSGLSGTEET